MPNDRSAGLMKQVPSITKTNLNHEARRKLQKLVSRALCDELHLGQS